MTMDIEDSISTIDKYSLMNMNGGLQIPIFDSTKKNILLPLQCEKTDSVIQAIPRSDSINILKLIKIKDSPAYGLLKIE
jgi:hypothetical protein